MTPFYPSPVDRLLKLGSEPARRRIWPDYRHLGLTARHIPALIQMATDPALHSGEEKGRAAWAPIHAWRALAQLGAESAAEPLLRLLEREATMAWVDTEVPQVLGMIGPVSLPGATLLLFDENKPDPVRMSAARVLTDVALEYPERRDESVAVISKQLEDWPHQSALLNAVLIGLLAELGATEVAGLMEAAFTAGAVDLTVNGDWEDVRIDLGLLDHRLTPPTPWSPIDEDEEDQPLSGRVPPSGTRAESKARERRKAQKRSRKGNRKKK